MAVISIRLNTEEEKMINFLSSYLEEDKSSLIKRSLTEMYEDIIDRKLIDSFELSEENKSPVYISSQDLLKDLA